MQRNNMHNMPEDINQTVSSLGAAFNDIHTTAMRPVRGITTPKAVYGGTKTSRLLAENVLFYAVALSELEHGVIIHWKNSYSCVIVSSIINFECLYAGLNVHRGANFCRL